MNEAFNERLTTIENSLTDITRVIKYKFWGGSDSNHEKFTCQHPYATKISSSYHDPQCILISKQYSTYEEANGHCAAYGGNLAVIENLRIVGNFLVEKEALAKYQPNLNSILSHDTLWVGAETTEDQSFPNELSWVNENGSTFRVSIPYTRYNGSSIVANKYQPGHLCGALRLDMYGNYHKLLAMSCDVPHRYPFLCEFDVDSDFLGEVDYDYTRTCPKDFSWELSKGECIYLSPISETLDYYQAGDFCEAKGATLLHPRKLSSFMEGMNEYHRRVINEKLNKAYRGGILEDERDEDEYLATGFGLRDYGIWINKSFRNDDQEWDDIMKQTEQNGNEASGTDMCILLKGSMSKRKVLREIAQCSSSQQFICSLNMYW